MEAHSGPYSGPGDRWAPHVSREPSAADRIRRVVGENKAALPCRRILRKMRRQFVDDDVRERNCPIARRRLRWGQLRDLLGKQKQLLSDVEAPTEEVDVLERQ